MQPVPDDLEANAACGVGEDAGVDLRAAVQQQRRDDQEDHAQDEPGGAGMRAEEPRDLRPSRCGLLRSRITVK